MCRRPCDRHERFLFSTLLDIVDRRNFRRQAERSRTEALKMRRGPSVAVVGMVEVGTLLADVTVRSSPCTLHMPIGRRPMISTASRSGELSRPNLLIVRCSTKGSVRTSAAGCGRSENIWRGTDFLLMERRSAGILHKRRSTGILDGCNGATDAAIRRSPRVGPIAKEWRGTVAAPALKVLILIAKGSRSGLGNDGRYGSYSICLLLGNKVGCCGKKNGGGQGKRMTGELNFVLAGDPKRTKLTCLVLETKYHVFEVETRTVVTLNASSANYVQISSLSVLFERQFTLRGSIPSNRNSNLPWRQNFWRESLGPRNRGLLWAQIPPKHPQHHTACIFRVS